MSVPDQSSGGAHGRSFLEALVLAIEWLTLRVGQLASWLAVTLVFTTFAVAVLRYGFNVGWVWLQESYVWMHSALFLLAASYALLNDAHVRIDIFYRSASIRTKAWINIFGTVFFLYPVLALFWWAILPYVRLSWFRFETSQEAGGLPGLFLLKSLMLAFVVLLALQGLALILRSVFVLKGRPEWDPEQRAARVEL
jgi:TRAP-type mannitol/chloroaromatic compound transport system permease small subunit